MKRAKLKHETAIFTTDGIEKYLTFITNNSNLALYVRGENISNPVILFVNGGPEVPLPGLCRFYENELIRHFTVVHYDQRGCGNSSENTGDFRVNLETYTDDVIRVTEYIRQYLSKEKVFLVGVSWGSIFGIKAACQRPDLFHAYIGAGQFISMQESEKLACEFIREKAIETGNDKAISVLEKLGNPPFVNYEMFMLERRLLKKMGGLDYNSNTRSRIRNQLVISPEYSLLELYFNFAHKSNYWQKLWPEISGFDAFSEVPGLDVPVFLLGGKCDYLTSASLAEKYIDSLKADIKEFYRFECSGHLLNIEEKGKFCEILREIHEKISEK